MSTVPVIKLEVERMKHTLLMMINDETLRLDEQLKAAVEAYCSEGNLTRVINEYVNVQMKRAIEDAVQQFYQWGPGKKLVAEVVYTKLIAEHEKIKEFYSGTD